MTVDDTIASADLQNPSDALEFLAHVADRAEGNQLPPISGYLRTNRPAVGGPSGAAITPTSDSTGNSNSIPFPPLQQGQLTVEDIHELQRRFGHDLSFRSYHRLTILQVRGTISSVLSNCEPDSFGPLQAALYGNKGTWSLDRNLHGCFEGRQRLVAYP